MAVNPLPFHTPTCVTVSAASSCGKTCLVAKMLRQTDWVFEKPVRNIVYCYAHHQDTFECLEAELSNITFHQGLPTEEILENLSDAGHHDILVIDDLIKECADSDLMESLFVRGSHHMNITVIHLTQNTFYHGKHRRTQAVNTPYWIFLRNPMGTDQVATFARQRFQGKSKAFIETYTKVTSVMYAYIVVDSHPKSDPKFAVRTGIFRDEDPIIYTFA